MASAKSNVEASRDRRAGVDGPRINIVSVLLWTACMAAGVGVTVMWNNPAGVIVGAVLGLITGASPQIAQQWERAVVLRLGRYAGLRGPGLFWIIPGIDRISAWVDQRVITTSFAAEQTLT